MIPVAHAVTQSDSLAVEEEIEFSIGDPRWVMRTQADLYSNRELAVAREYSTNAFDANKERALEQGTKVRPIEVTLPSMMNPNFVVRDFGYGMGIDDLRNVYTKFGVSTKRDSNEYNGQLGYGSKSAVAYTNTFTVTSVHEGVKRVAIVVRKPDWSIVMKIVSTHTTDEPSGTEISVPVHNWEKFSQVANDFYAFWLPGRVLVNGKAPEHSVGDKIADNLYFSPNWNRSYVVMGNVPYRIENPEALFEDTKMNQINFVAYVDDISRTDGVAAVEFTPSREDLKYTDRTIDTLKRVITDFSEHILDTAQDEISNSATHAEAFKNWCKWTSHLGMAMFDALEFKGDVFEPNVKISASRYANSGYRNDTYRIAEWSVESFEKTLVVTEFTITVSSNAKTKAKEYAKQMGWDVNYILFTHQSESEISSPWIERDQFISWEALKAALPKQPRVSQAGTLSGRPKGSYDYYTLNGFTEGKSVPATGHVSWISHHESKRHNVRSLIINFKYSGSIIVLRANRIEKFKRENPKSPNFIQHLRDKVVINTETLLSEDAKRLMNYSDSTRAWARKIALSRVNDPAWAEVVALESKRSTLMKDYEANLSLANSVGLGYTIKKYQPQISSDLMKRYPLLTDIGLYGRTDMEHLHLYLNAAYAAESENN